MFTSRVFATLSLLGLGLASQVSAAEQTSPQSAARGTPQERVLPPGHPCAEVMAACKAAGFIVGGHKDGKGIHADCVGKLFKGESVVGVSVGADKVQACQSHHEGRMGGPGMLGRDRLPAGHPPAGGPHQNKGPAEGKR